MLVSKLRNLLVTMALLTSWWHLGFSQSSTGPMLNRTDSNIADKNSVRASMDDSYAEGPKESSRWTFSIESIYAFGNIENPWFVAALHPHKKNPLDYKFVTEILSVRYRLTETGGPLFLRGNLEVGIGPIFAGVVNGPESYFVGAVGGFRYNFVQLRARLIPYLELRGGIGKSDSRKIDRALQSDATLTYLLGGGLRYELSSRWSVAVGGARPTPVHWFLCQSRLRD